MTQPALTATGVVKRYERGSLALDGVDLTVGEGTITGFVGPNGAGKSTLIKAWVGIERPSQGQVRVLGIDPWQDRPAALARVGYVPQTPSLYRSLTVADHLALASSARRTFDRRLALTRLDDLGIIPRSVCRTLSGGQQAQVSLALALGTRAPVLLLDEPLASLDPLARREFLHVLVDDVRANGTTALLTSHVITDVAQACDHLVVLGAGHKVLDEAIKRALARHRVVPGAVHDASLVASFPDAQGQIVTLLDGSTLGHPATLEEVVIGYLTVGRGDAAGAPPNWFAPGSQAVIAATIDDGLISFDQARGQAVVVGTGTAVADVLAALAADESGADLMGRHPGLTPEDIRASLRYAALLTRGSGARGEP
jgi:ABC-2 type transport system ATP-binding protein